FAHRRREDQRLGAHELHRECPRKRFHLVPVVARRNRHDEVQTLATGRLEKPVEIEAFEQPARELASVTQRRPFERGVGIEVERDAIGSVETRKAYAPRMEFKHAVLHGANDIFERLQMKIRRRIGLRNGTTPNIARMTLKEAMREV